MAFFAKLAQLPAEQKLAATAAATLALVTLAATLLRLNGLVGPFTSRTAGALAGAMFALAIKWILQGLVADDHLFYKQGYDLCIMALSTSLTAFVAVFSLFFFGLPAIGDTLRVQTAHFGVLAGGVLIGTGIAAVISKYMNKAKQDGLGSLAIFAIGTVLFVVNIYVVLTK
jgi:hypothetical protein